MHRKQVLFVADGLEITDRIQRVLREMDADVSIGSVSSLDKIVASKKLDLVIVDADREISQKIHDIENRLFEDGPISLLLIVYPESLPKLRLPVRIDSDFVVRDAREEEFAARIHQLLWPGEEASTSDFIRIDRMSINLATYQVKVDGDPLDFTYLEYALLAFLVTHPGRTYSRDALLRRVWGFEYYGGSRTVDVHVRRVRAKLGPELAQRLETVRGVGYLWNA